MFMIPRIDKPNKARFLYDLVARDSNSITEPPNIPDQSSIINTIDRYPFRSKIDLTDGCHNIRIHPAHEKHTAFVTPYGTYGTRVRQEGDCNATATFQKIMNNLFRDELGIYVYVHIDDIFIFSNTYKQHLAHVRTVLLRLKDHQFYASSDESQFLPDVLSVLEYIITKRSSSHYLKMSQKFQIGPILEKGRNCSPS